MRLIFILLIFCPLLSPGQSFFGIKAFSNLSYTNPSTQRPRLTASGGIFLQENINKIISLRQEALFKLEGYSFKQDIPPQVNTTGDTIRDLGLKTISNQVNFIEIPLLINVTTGEKVKPYLGVGCSFKFSVYSKQRVKVEYRNWEYDPLNSNGFDVNILGQIGIETIIKEIPYHLEVRYSHGLIKIVDDYKFRSFSFLIGFKI